MEAMKATANAGISMKQDKGIKTTAVVMVLLVGTASAMLSWSGLTFLGMTAGFGGISWLLPLSIDGMLVLGSSLILHNTLTNQRTWFGWVITAVGVALSIWGNIASVGAHDMQSQVVHAVPPLTLFLSIEAGVRILKNRISVSQELAALAEKEAIKEARRLEKLAEQEKVAVAIKTKDTAVLLSVPKRGGTKTSETDPEVATYKGILDALPADVSKIGKVEAILREHPAARTTHIAFATGQDARQLGTTVQRAKAKLLKEAGQGKPVATASKEAPAPKEPTEPVSEDQDSSEGKFQEIVRTF
jgi:hypothetical protein